MLPPGRKRTHQPSSDHIIGNSQDGDAPRSSLRSVYRRIASRQNDIGSGRNKLDRKRRKTVLSGLEAARIDGQMLSLNDSELPQFIEEGCKVRLLPPAPGQNAKPK